MAMISIPESHKIISLGLLASFVPGPGAGRSQIRTCCSFPAIFHIFTLLLTLSSASVAMQASNSYGPNIPISPDGMIINPKLWLTRRNSPTPSIMRSSSPPVPPSPQLTSGNVSLLGQGPRDVTYKIRAFDNEAGNLYAVCRAVPYLLGPKSMLDALITMRSAKLPDDAFIRNETRGNLDPKKLSFMDRALLLVLFLLQTPLEDHSDSIRQLLAHFDHRKDALVVYKDMGTNKPPACTIIRISDWVNMAVEWLYIGNPGNISPDRPDAITPWQKIQPYLQARSIPAECLTKAVYERWIMTPEEHLNVRLNEFVRSGEYDRLVQARRTRDASSRATSRLGFYSNVVHYTPPPPSDPLEWGTKRFSHEHPCGKLIDYTSQRHDNALLSESSGASDKLKGKETLSDSDSRPIAEDEKLRASARQFGRTKAWWKKMLRYFLVVVTVGGIVAGIVLAVYFHMSKKGPSGGMKNVENTGS